MNWFTGTTSLIRLALRRDRWRLPIWLVSITGIVYASAAAVGGLYTTPSQIKSYADVVGTSPMTVAFAGPPLGLDTVAGIVVYETSFTAIVGVVLMAVMTSSRHTRAEEESGRSELGRSTVVGRHAGSAAALFVSAGACLVLGLLLSVSLATTPLGWQASAVYGAGLGLLGVVYAGLTLAVAQLFVHARTVTGAGLALFAAGYIVRAAGDVREDWLVWLSPVGWVQASHVPTENRWWPLILPVAATVLLVVLAVALAERRDFGGGLLPTIPGRAEAPPSLSGTVGLAWRLQRGALLGWGLAVLAMAALTGTLGNSMIDMVENNPSLAQYLALAEGGSVIDSYLATMALLMGLVVAGFATWSAGRAVAEESEGLLELLVAGPLSRARSLLGNLLVTVASSTLLLLASATGLGGAHAWVTGDVGQGLRMAGAQLAYLPAVLVLIGVVVLVAGWRRSWTWVGWVVLTYWAVLGWLGGLLQPPAWTDDLSAFAQTPRVPLESASGPALWLLSALAVALVAMGLAGFRRRDLG